MTGMNQNEMRLDPLRQSWTIFAPSRAGKPPHLSNHGNGSEPVDPSPFDPGYEHLLPRTLLALDGVRVVPNRAPALRVEGSPAVTGDGFYDRTGAVGAHEVIIETPGKEPLEALSLPQFEKVLDSWKIRMLDLTRDSRMRAFFVVKNVGKEAGAAYSHSISQLIAMALVPPALKQKLEVARDFYERKRRAIFDDILREEIRVGSRMVYENNGFAVFCPYASRTPFELAIYPKRQCADFHGITDQERTQLADVLRTALRKLVRSLDSPPYQLALTTAPSRTNRRDHWNTIDDDFRWHIEIVPALAPGGGLELGTGCYVNTVMPEIAAEFMRTTEG